MTSDQETEPQYDLRTDVLVRLDKIGMSRNMAEQTLLIAVSTLLRKAADRTEKMKEHEERSNLWHVHHGWEQSYLDQALATVNAIEIYRIYEGFRANNHKV